MHDQLSLTRRASSSRPVEETDRACTYTLITAVPDKTSCDRRADYGTAWSLEVFPMQTFVAGQLQNAEA